MLGIKHLNQIVPSESRLLNPPLFLMLTANKYDKSSTVERSGQNHLWAAGELHAEVWQGYDSDPGGELPLPVNVHSHTTDRIKACQVDSQQWWPKSVKAPCSFFPTVYNGTWHDIPYHYLLLRVLPWEFTNGYDRDMILVGCQRYTTPLLCYKSSDIHPFDGLI